MRWVRECEPDDEVGWLAWDCARMTQHRPDKASHLARDDGTASGILEWSSFYLAMPATTFLFLSHRCIDDV
jgi:hypothetical protein